MDPNSKEELEKMYQLVASATATTNFYNRIYKYIAFIKQSDFISTLLEKDYIAWHEYDIERLDSRPNQQDGENDLDFFVKEMKHMSSGDRVFLSHYLTVIDRDIFNLLDWHYTEGFQSEEVSIMLNGRKKVSLISRLEKYINRHDIIHTSEEDFNKVYIDRFPYWKNFIADFHTLLLEKINKESITLQAMVRKEIVESAKTVIVEKLVPVETILTNTPKTFYDTERSVLVIDGMKHLVVRKAGGNYVHDILKHIFENDPAEEYFYSEMNEREVLGDIKDWKVYYKALDTFRSRLAKESGPSDFFEKLTTYTTGSVKINSKYL